MSFRTSEAEVKKIMETTLEEEELTPFLVMANQWVSGVLAYDTLYREELRAALETLATAHLASTCRDPRIAEEAAGPVSVRYTGQWGSGLKGSPYGQQLLAMDYKNYFQPDDEQSMPGLVTLG